MSDPVSIVQAAYACFGRGDIPALLQLLTEDVDWQFCGDSGAPYTTRVRGRGQVAEWFGIVAAMDDIQVFEPRSFLAGPDHVTVLGYENSRARQTGKPFACEWVHVWWLRDGRVQRFWGMLDSEVVARARVGA